VSATPRFRQGAGRLSLDFIRTLRHRGSPDVVEELPDAEALLAWVRQCGPCADVTGHPDAANARELREAVHARLTSTGHLTRHADDPVRATLSLVARDALDLVTSPSLARLRNCAGPNCGALFLDTSRPGNRRWCSMGTCGNRAKKETLRGRTA
jgi:hypothetical protein